MVAVVAIATTLLGVAALVLPNALAYEDVKAHLDSMAVDGTVEFLTPEYYASVGKRLAVLGMFLTAIGAALVAFRRRIADAAGRVYPSLRPHLRSLIGDILSIRRHGMHFYALCGIVVIGLLVRLFGYDPMQRKLEPEAKTYWLEHRTGGNPSSYFRQF